MHFREPGFTAQPIAVRAKLDSSPQSLARPLTVCFCTSPVPLPFVFFLIAWVGNREA
jgi:hypothetical protein